MRLAAEAKPRDEGKSEKVFFHGDQLTEVGWFFKRIAVEPSPPPRFAKKKKEEERNIFVT
jgi:hypothetical protein